MIRTLLAAATLTLLAGGAFTPPGSAQSADGRAAFFWFDSRKISDAGESFYGAYAYRRLLPAFSPQRRPGNSDAFAFFDGDFLPQSPLDIPHQGDEASVAGEARKLGSLAYAIAVYAYQAPAPFRDVDTALRAARTIGYLGFTTRDPISLEAFIQLTRRMSLPVTMKQEGATLRIASFAYLGDAELRKMGFEPIRPR